MVHQERLEIGEKSFVGSTLAVLGLEASLTVITLGMHFSWVGLMLGVVGFCLVMVLANRIYAGSQQAQRLALGWIVFQAIYAGYALYLLGSSAQGVEMARQIGAPAAWPVVLKALAYLFWAWVLVRMPTVRDFFAEKRGEPRPMAITPTAPIASLEPSTPLNLTAEQNLRLGGLARSIKLAVGALIALGVLQILMSELVFGLQGGNLRGILVLLQGLLTVTLGVALGAPANEVRVLTDPAEQTQRQLTGTLGSLARFYKAQIIIGLLLVVVMVARVVITLG